MRLKEIDEIRRWFDDYVASFYSTCGRLHQLELKERHSHRVAENAGLLADELGWDESARHLAVAAGLLHDLGRFPQYRDYGTFYDFRSLDHGDRGERVFREDFPGDIIDPIELELIAFTTREHNKKDLPVGRTEKEMELLKLIKDSDRIDIFRVVREHIKRGETDSIYPGIGPEGQFTPAVLDELRRYGKARYDQLRTLSDVLLFQLCWIKDMAHPQSVELLRDRGDLEWILDRLPENSTAAEILGSLKGSMLPSQTCR
ncbi:MULTISPECIES: HD domain-containing protein [Dethiosulfovibrio]|uniref:HD domain-containing protein n=2 Tax=Dethiosulfovibrio TaxID=47054 RepID=A0ABS9EN93_9BACT|nr:MULTISPECIES: HD domain-containing protein [Dethiosulfovibrio]MCF4114147.1 HD domain-containing protein [Dethiosulfovibrio russensis]MCF4142663.1 HD domain-containing protein [Dethiosulfovibrio marinus]MCF4145182.1 HD domain-containing protein [Dethiosulfovibrio acidaminovorans]MEA3284951.1 HD domain-containing protein [Synergistota bacterium]